MTDFERVLMNRDHMTREEAKAERQRAKEEVLDMLEDGCSYDDVADMLAGDYMLEPDYIMDLI